MAHKLSERQEFQKSGRTKKKTEDRPASQPRWCWGRCRRRRRWPRSARGWTPPATPPAPATRSGSPWRRRTAPPTRTPPRAAIHHHQNTHTKESLSGFESPSIASTLLSIFFWKTIAVNFLSFFLSAKCYMSFPTKKKCLQEHVHVVCLWTEINDHAAQCAAPSVSTQYQCR